MPALPVIADISRVVLNWDAGGQQAVNVLHFSAPGMSESDIFAGIDAHVTDTMWDAVSQNAFIRFVDVQFLDGTSAVQRFVTAGAKWAGNGGTQWVPATCALIKLSTALRGRSNHGRIYLPDIAEDLQQNGFLDGTSTSTMSAAWVTFANAIQPDMALGVASYLNADWHQATTIVCENPVATQRRRQGRNR